MYVYHTLGVQALHVIPDVVSEHILEFEIVMVPNLLKLKATTVC